jgi:hypothetical protein
MPKHDEQDEDENTPTLTKASAKGKGPIEDNGIENEDDSPDKKTKVKSGRKQVQKNKTNLQETAENENGNHDLFFKNKKLIFKILEQHDEKQKITINRKGKNPVSSKNEETPINDDLKLSEDDETTDDKMKGAIAKKAPTKRSAPASSKKTGVTSAKKKGQNDEPFDDRTNDEVENNTEDLEASSTKQSKKGRTGDKAPPSASKTTNRAGKKTK